jgi:hypothetical protein
MATLPQPDITVTDSADDKSSAREFAVTASRDGKSRTWTGTGPDAAGAVKGVVEKMLGDPQTAEYVRRS